MAPRVVDDLIIARTYLAEDLFNAEATSKTLHWFRPIVIIVQRITWVLQAHWCFMLGEGGGKREGGRERLQGGKEPKSGFVSGSLCLRR